MFVPIIKRTYLYLKQYVIKCTYKAVKPTRYKKKPKDPETTSVTVLFNHTTSACRGFDEDDDDDDDGAQRQEPPPPETNLGTRGNKKDRTLNSLSVGLCWGKRSMQTIHLPFPT